VLLVSCSLNVFAPPASPRAKPFERAAMVVYLALAPFAFLVSVRQLATAKAFPAVWQPVANVDTIKLCQALVAVHCVSATAPLVMLA
jgi:hypothetical protein